MPAKAPSKTDFSIEAIMKRGQSSAIELNGTTSGRSGGSSSSSSSSTSSNSTDSPNQLNLIDVIKSKQKCNTVTSPSYLCSSSSSSSSSSTSSSSSSSSSSLSSPMSTLNNNRNNTNNTNNNNNNNNKQKPSTSCKSQITINNDIILHNQKHQHIDHEQHHHDNNKYKRDDNNNNTNSSSSSSSSNNNSNIVATNFIYPPQPKLLTPPQSEQVQFHKSNMVQLADGKLKKVEELTSKDFVECATSSSESIRVDSSIVKDLQENNDKSVVLVRFIVESCRNSVSMEVPSEHPFFVYDQGWSSMAPQKTLDRFGLKCRKLRVADVCVTLTLRQQPQVDDNNNNTINTSNVASSSYYNTDHIKSPYSINNHNNNNISDVNCSSKNEKDQQNDKNRYQLNDFALPLRSPSEPYVSSSFGQQSHTSRIAFNNSMSESPTNDEDMVVDVSDDTQQIQANQMMSDQSQSLLRIWIERFAPYLATQQQHQHQQLQLQHQQQIQLAQQLQQTSLMHQSRLQQPSTPTHLQQSNNSCHENINPLLSMFKDEPT